MEINDFKKEIRLYCFSKDTISWPLVPPREAAMCQIDPNKGKSADSDVSFLLIPGKSGGSSV